MKKQTSFLLLLAAFLAFALPVRLAAQVSVAPVALFLDEQNRFGTFYVANQSNAQQEVIVETRFGYPSADSLGNVVMEYADSTAEQQYSIGNDLRIFPRQFVLPEGETQIVRLTLPPRPDMDEGYYWSRIVTTASQQAAFTDTSASGVQAQVNFRLRQITAVLYRHGSPTAEVGIEDLEAAADSGSVTITAQIERGGNAPFLGSALLEIKDADGNTVLESTQTMAAYFSMRRRFEVPADSLAAGNYTASLRLSSKRGDIPPSEQVNMQPVSETTSFSVE